MSKQKEKKDNRKKGVLIYVDDDNSMRIDSFGEVTLEEMSVMKDFFATHVMAQYLFEIYGMVFDGEENDDE
jgi:hypothetical protein